MVAPSMARTGSETNRSACGRVAWAALLLLLILAAAPRLQAASSPKPAAMLAAGFGDAPCMWSPPVADKDGHPDAVATLHALQANGFSCYGALLWQGKHVVAFNLDGLKHLLQVFQPAGIDVWAVLIPPSEGGDSMPYKNDYVKWMQALARLSLQYPHLRGVNIDDYLSSISVKTFTPQYNCQLYQAKQQINPSLQFVPTVYFINRQRLRQFGRCMDGVWLWWTNLERGDAVAAWLQGARAIAGPTFPIYAGVYGRWTSWHKQQDPKPQAFRETLQSSCRHSDGAIIWQVPLDHPGPLLEIAKDFGHKGTAGGCRPESGAQ